MKCLLLSLFLQLALLAPAQATDKHSYQLSLERQKLFDKISSQHPRMNSRVREIMYLRDQDEGVTLMFWALTNASGSGRIPWLLIHGPSRIDWKKLGAELTPQTIKSILAYSGKNQAFTLFSETLLLTSFLEGRGFSDPAFLNELFSLAKVQLQNSSRMDADLITESLLLLSERASFEGAITEDLILNLISAYATYNSRHPGESYLHIPFGITRAYTGDLYRHYLNVEAVPGPWKNFEPKSHMIPESMLQAPRVQTAILSFLKDYSPTDYERELRDLKRSGRQCSAFE